MTESKTLDTEIDELAQNVEQSIEETEKTMASMRDFNPKHRRMAEADVTEIFDA